MEAKHHVVMGNPLSVKAQQTKNHCVIDQATTYFSPCSTSAAPTAASSLCGSLGQHGVPRFDAQYKCYHEGLLETASHCGDVLYGLGALATDG
ncbi:hypothetical protein KRP22_011710 [Phytophthora ramorum]|uniref:uncharacterized protein n=1 Tax=Phytophthora ramorum TaxID=164328 RepID=UPI0030B00EEC|nr:hypothetical protein KRP23_11223 [Phytophthora ramorum]KAH7498400.1 hypothetical protein KRP22_11544 [Phytophthora ramorum]KAH7499277.1 hypothetical protein KRP22_10766 [Phytophthora ramorum]